MKAFADREDEGSLMLDGMIVMLMTIMILVFLLGFGFLLYQQWAVCNIANDTATRIAQSYAYPNTDPVIGYVNTDLLESVPLFRYAGDSLAAQNESKGRKYAAWSLKQSSFAYPVSDPVISVETKHDALARRHVEVTIQAEYEIPFGGALEYFGLSRTVTYSGTGEAVCANILDYVNTVDTFKALTDQTFGSKALGAVNSILGTIRKIRDLFE